jgi:hypothetical protein
MFGKGFPVNLGVFIFIGQEDGVEEPTQLLVFYPFQVVNA